MLSSDDGTADRAADRDKPILTMNFRSYSEENFMLLLL